MLSMCVYLSGYVDIWQEYLIFLDNGVGFGFRHSEKKQRALNSFKVAEE